MSEPNQDTIDGVVLADLIVSFVAKGGMYNAQALMIALRLIHRAKAGTNEEERKLLDAAVAFLVAEQET